MTDALRVDSAALADAAAFADSVANALIDKQLALAGQISELLDAGWRGQGADSCRNAWETWTDGFRHVIAGLSDEALALRLAAVAYTSGDADESDQISDAGQRF
ncbi:WXG100 family type VII secretion target [Mycolicibacterium fluoranthenivorans]|uniref:WXG100 family type VII secretion target n=1 Tax=Mycolicibacterium fluoranthenivorans TaxID=258505 RepID=A0A1G4W264_9MYCO|nr:WXG100 family type VII secretion target [Mycolicibacterium fluoranthenivorans]SCX15477.1 WXG100 family type VII secretion target [Mycolicibacterium fluoranthenivorans]